jgi:hypothetical protein
MRYLPLLIVPFLLYNAFAFLIFKDYAHDFPVAELWRVVLPSGETFSLTVSTTIVLLAVLLLGIEVVKAARIGAGSIVDHIFATILLIAFVVEFLLVPQAATGTFVVLAGIALIDLICGFAVSIRSASRDISIET